MNSLVPSSRSSKGFDGAGEGERGGALEASSSLREEKSIRSGEAIRGGKLEIHYPWRRRRASGWLEQPSPARLSLAITSEDGS